MENIYDLLNARGLVKQVTDESLRDRLNQPITVYCGFDPTGDSLHVGHLMPIVLLKHFEMMGHNPIALIGGATGCIGDPSGKNQERQLNSYEIVQHNVDQLTMQISRFFEQDKVRIVNNFDWIKEINTIEFLRDYGKYFNVNTMLAKDSVASRIDSGISFAEFSYQILQALDLKHLNEKYNCELQIGGSDQWGNLTAGTELVRKTNSEKVTVYGMTVPLVTKADGTKFGKSEGGAVWLDPKKTSPYEFYQFFYNVEDSKVIDYLKTFTFLSLDDINELEASLQSEPFKRKAQTALATEVTKFVHGIEAVEMVAKISEILFTGNLSLLTKAQIEENFHNMKQYVLAPDMNIVDAMIEAELASSKREAREFLKNGSISLNGSKISEEIVITDQQLIENTYCLIKRGKKKYALIKVASGD